MFNSIFVPDLDVTKPRLMRHKEIAHFSYDVWRKLQLPVVIQCDSCEHSGSEIVYIPTCLTPDGMELAEGTCRNCGKKLFAQIHFFLS